MGNLILLIAAAFMVSTAIYLGQQAMTLRKVNKIMAGVVATMNAIAKEPPRCPSCSCGSTQASGSWEPTP